MWVQLCWYKNANTGVAYTHMGKGINYPGISVSYTGITASI